MWPLQSLIWLIYLSGAHGLKLQIEEFYSKSFVPDEIHIAYDIVRFEEINFNLSVEVPFPGKLLLHIFVRKLSDQVGGSDQDDLVRFKNRDLCKLLDALRNITVEETPGESLLPPTFVISCPLVPGFYYVEKSTVDEKLIPFRIPDGRYMILLELIQVYEEVMKLVTTRIKFAMRRPPGYKEPVIDFDSSEEAKVSKNREDEKKESNNEAEEKNKESNNAAEEGKKESSNKAEEEKKEATSEVTEPSDDNYEPEEEKKESSPEVTEPSYDNY